MRLLAHGRARLGLALLAAFALLALVGPWLIGDARAALGGAHEPPSWAHPFGTTGLGQDVLAQTVVGARATLAVGAGVGLVTLLVSALVGVSAGYARGWLDEALTLGTSVFLVIPGMPLAIVLAAFLPPGPLAMATVLTLTGWAWGARVLRAQTLSLSRRDFVAAARVSGEGAGRILAREILPHLASLLVSCFIGTTVYAIGAQVALEFLGLGDPGRVTWGTNLYWAANDAALVVGAWWTFVPTGLCVALVGLALALVSSGIDETTNPRLTAERRFRASTGLRVRLGAVLRPAAPPVLPAPTTGAPPPFPGDPVLTVRDLRVVYQSGTATLTAVDGVSFELHAAEILGLAGESGSGKSTLAGAMLRVLRPPALVTAGQVLHGGRDLLALEEPELRRFRWREASMVFQSAMNALNPVLSVEQQLVDTVRAHEPGVSRRAARDRAVRLLGLAGLRAEVARRFAHQLSGGMRQRAVIAMALALSPRILVMDEPTTALDVVVQREILGRLRGLRRELGLSILLITHDLPLLLDVADRIGVMYAGELVELAPAATLVAEARHPYTRGLLAAFPHLGAGSAGAREIPGAAPALGRWPAGCRFHPRCAEARPSCATQRPSLRALTCAQRVACPHAAPVVATAPRQKEAS